ncbi:ATP synthase subunit 4, mitochondrial [Smittium mucronatum]|uniref:ATP synthase subunit 4 n=1 Tax=Smittium mucronatum TaxID=133383 RepID=A0A1R0H249_9FUNG|nr:ATP synthase subunit 4, mitochondrial [Smittium mucronatum]
MSLRLLSKQAMKIFFQEISCMKSDILSLLSIANMVRVSGTSSKAPSFVVYRLMSTSAEKPEPVDKANSIINMFPGDSIVAKTGYIFAATGVTAFLVSKELYVFNSETVVLAAFGGLVALLYTKVRQPLNEWVAEYGDSLKKILTDARNGHKSAVETKIDSLSQLKDIVPTTKSMFDLSREMVSMMAEINELKQKIAIRQEVKTVLDSWVRYEDSIRQNEQRQVSEQVIGNVRQQLSSPKIQQELIQQCLNDLKKLKVAA